MTETDLPQPAESALFVLLSLMDGLSDEERVEVYREMKRHYCDRCGAAQIPTGRSTCVCELPKTQGGLL